ncbi:MAG TPA: hypothetical protein VKU85_06410, partial [bacterium]|nr:hypothetical protein [bacterium]
MPAFLAHIAGSEDAAGADLLLVPATSAADLPRRLRRVGPGLGSAADRALDLGDFAAEPGRRLLIHSRGFEGFPRVLLVGLSDGVASNPALLRRELTAAMEDPVFQQVDT